MENLKPPSICSSRIRQGKVWANVREPHDMSGLAIKPLAEALFDLT